MTPATSSRRLHVLRCPCCNAVQLRADVDIQKGKAEVEGVCRRCKARIVWALDSEGRVSYSILEKGKR